jgi:hypothetical protein
MVAVIMGSHHRVTTGSFHVVLQLVPLFCKIPPAIPLMAKCELRKIQHYVLYYGASCARISECILMT